MGRRSLPLDSLQTDMDNLRGRLASDAARELLQTADGVLGPLGKVVVVFRVLNEHMLLSAGKMAVKLWDAVDDWTVFGGEPKEKTKRSFVNRVVTWLQPSQKFPFNFQESCQGKALEEAASKVVGNLLGKAKGDLLRLPLRLRADELVSKLQNPEPNSGTGINRIDPAILKDQPLFSPGHLSLVAALSSYLEEGDDVDFLCIVGEPYSGQDSIIHQVIVNRYLAGARPLPVFALSCRGLTYAQVGAEVLRFLEQRLPAMDDPGARIESNRLRLIQECARRQAAVYIFLDLELMNSDPAGRLIRQEDVVSIIDIISHSNSQTRVIISCEELPAGMAGVTVKDGYISRRVGIGWACVRVYLLAPPTTELLFRALNGENDPDQWSDIGAMTPPRPVDGVALDLCKALCMFTRQGQGQGAEAVTALLNSAQAAGEKLQPGPVFERLWGVLPHLQRLLCLVIAASDDGVRESSLALTLMDLADEGLLDRVPPDEERDSALESLQTAFGKTLRQEERWQEWLLDDLASTPRRERVFEFHRLVRRIILETAEGLGPDYHSLVRRVHRFIARRAREKSYNRRLNTSGVYGARLDDLSRDIQALLSLIASVDEERDHVPAPRNVIPPLDVEREVFYGHADSRTIQRFAFLQMWQQDIDRDYRLNTLHAADELRLQVLLAMVCSPGNSVFPPRHYEVLPEQVDRMRSVFSVEELLEFLVSLATAAYQSGAFKVVHDVARYAENTLARYAEEHVDDGRRAKRAILGAKLQRAHVDACTLAGSDMALAEVETHLRDVIGRLGDDPGGKQARLKLYLRLGDICYLQGEVPTSYGCTKHDDAQNAFEAAVALEKELAAGESCPSGRALISGLGARRFVRAELNWAAAEVRAAEVKSRDPNWQVVDAHMRRARDVHLTSLRRLSRHAADRAGVLLDEARLRFVEATIRGRRSGEDIQEAHKQVKNILMKAHAFIMQPGLPIAVKLDLDGHLVRIVTDLGGFGMAGLTAGADSGHPDQEVLETCERSLQRMLRVAEQFDLRMHKAYSLLLRFKFHSTRYGTELLRKPGEIEKLRLAREICDRVGLGIYKKEIEECLKLTG